MSNCVIRVELHRARTSEQYALLHQNLAQFGINNTIVSSTGRRYRLPPAEYYYTGSATRDQLLQTAKRCATSVDPSNAVVVTESTAVTWDGLAPV